MKKLSWIILIVFVFTLGIGTTAMAADDSDITTDEESQIFVYNGPIEPLGNLSSFEAEELMSHSDEFCSDSHGSRARHAALQNHSHVVTGITRTYNSEIARGVVLQGSNPTGAATTLTYSKERAVANSYTSNIGVDSGVLSASVGFSVTTTGARTASYTVSVPRGRTVNVRLFDVYTKKDFRCQTKWMKRASVNGRPTGSWVLDRTENGSGTAIQWRNFRFTHSYS